SGAGHNPAFAAGGQERSNRIAEPGYRGMDGRRWHEVPHAFRIGIPRLDRLPVLVPVGEVGQPEQRYRRLTGVSVGAEEEAIAHETAAERGGAGTARTAVATAAATVVSRTVV